MRTLKMRLQVLARLVGGVAWLFALGTVALVALSCVLLMFVPHPDRHCTMMTDGLTDAWGLTFVGRRGAILALLEFVVVVAALWASKTHPFPLRAIGHLLLILWAGLWMANAFYVFPDGTSGLIYIIPFFFLATCLRAALGLSRTTTPGLANRLGNIREFHRGDKLNG